MIIKEQVENWRIGFIDLMMFVEQRMGFFAQLKDIFFIL